MSQPSTLLAPPKSDVPVGLRPVLPAEPDPASPLPAAAAADRLTLPPLLSQKLRFWSLAAMLLLLYVHAYNLHPRRLEPGTIVQEPFSAATWVEYFLANGLLRFRIPLLFAISGYLCAHFEGKTTHLGRVRRRVRTLLVPYLAWSALALALTWGLEQLAATRPLVLAAGLSPFGPAAPLVGAYSLRQVLHVWLVAPLPFQLWFIRSLFVYILAYPWLRAVVGRAPGVYFPVAAGLWVLAPALPLVEGSGLLFFALGIWLRATGADVLRAPRWFRTGPLLALWLAIVTAKTGLAFYPVPHSFFLMSVLHSAGEALGLLVMWFGSDRLVRAAMRQAWFKWLTGFSFIIYALHEPLLNYATEAALRAWPQQPLLVFGLLPLALLVVIVLLAAGLRRAAPALYGLLTGDRGR